MKRALVIVTVMLLLLAVATAAVSYDTTHPASAHDRDYEVWVIDQSDTADDGA